MDDHLEDNDLPGNASPISVGQIDDLQVCRGNDDYYALGLANGEWLELTTYFSHIAGDIDIALFDPTASSVVAYSISITDNEAITFTATVSGPYFVRAYGYQSAVNGYDLCVDDPLEPNDGFGTAPSVIGTVTGLQVCRSDRDCYAIDLTVGDALRGRRR